MADSGHGPSRPTIRLEQSEDIAAIHALTERAFRGKSYADGTEPLVNDRLREAGALTLSLVAEVNGQIVGHIAFSPLSIDGEFADYFALGPVSVGPLYQGQGLGSNLIHTGIQMLKDQGARGIILLGDPKYYGRFGFESQNGLTYQGQPSPYLQCLQLKGTPPSGAVSFHAAFGDEAA